MLAVAPSTPPVLPDDDAFADAGLAARVASGPGFWTGWLAELDRAGLLEELLADDVIARALREAPAGHRYDRVLNAKMTVICVLVACLFPGAGYDTVLATAFGLPGLRFKPGTEAPAGSAFSQARKLLGEQVMKRTFELDAERPDGELGITELWKGLEVTALDGTTMELARNGVLEDAFGTPADGARPLPPVRRARAHRHRPVDRRRARRLPRRRERPGRPARGHVRGRDAEPRRPRVLLHGPVAAVLRQRRGPGLARQERSGFYEWRNAPESAAARRRGILALYVKKSFGDSDETYGYRRVHADLAAWGVPGRAGAGPVGDAGAGPGALPAPAVAGQPHRGRRPGTRHSRPRAPGFHR